MHIKRSGLTLAFNAFSYLIIGLLAVLCLLPFVIILSGSFTDNATIIREGYSLIPKKFSWEAYKTLFAYPETILRAYAVTTVNTIVGSVLGLAFTAMAGYVLSRPDFKYRNRISFLIYFTSIFGGGMVPWYIMITKTLNLGDTYAALCLPGLTTPFLIILMRTFIVTTLPDAVVESARIDGAGHFRTFCSIVIPIIKPGLATVGLFLALSYWNDWYRSSLFITTPGKQELQFYLYNMLNGMEALTRMLAGKVSVSMAQAPTESVKLAMAVVATGPMLLLYPLVQRFFVKGITMGSVKG